MEEDDERCPRCGKPDVWRHAIDQTNGIEYDAEGNALLGTVHWPLEVDRYELVVIPEHVESRPIYKIPMNPRREVK
jgi:hypothetical protein